MSIVYAAYVSLGEEKGDVFECIRVMFSSASFGKLLSSISLPRFQRYTVFLGSRTKLVQASWHPFLSPSCETVLDLSQSADLFSVLVGTSCLCNP